MFWSKVNTAADWSGYINDLSLNGETYGYLWSISNSVPTRKLRLVCRSNGVFTLYANNKIPAVAAPSTGIVVDRLAAIRLATKPVDQRNEISSHDPEFWRLIARMSAGANLTIDSGADGKHQYSLSGFTKTFLKICGWSGDARKFEEYIHQYR